MEGMARTFGECNETRRSHWQETKCIVVVRFVVTWNYLPAIFDVVSLNPAQPPHSRMRSRTASAPAGVVHKGTVDTAVHPPAFPLLPSHKLFVLGLPDPGRLEGRQDKTAVKEEVHDEKYCHEKRVTIEILTNAWMCVCGVRDTPDQLINKTSVLLVEVLNIGLEVGESSGKGSLRFCRRASA